MLQVITTIAITALVVAIAGYIYLLRPAQQRERCYYQQAVLLATQLADERQLRADLMRWIEVECQHFKAAEVQAALQQRVEERLAFHKERVAFQVALQQQLRQQRHQ